jgi:hypothetical protein
MNKHHISLPKKKHEENPITTTWNQTLEPRRREEREGHQKIDLCFNPRSTRVPRDLRALAANIFSRCVLNYFL